MISRVFASGASGLRSSWASIARNSSLRRPASCNSSAWRRSCISIRFRSVMSETRQRAPLMRPPPSRSGSTVTWSQQSPRERSLASRLPRLEHLGEQRALGLGGSSQKFGEVFPDDLGPRPPQDALESPVGLHDLPGAVEEHDAVADGVERGLPLARRELSGVLGPAGRRRARTVAISSSGSATLVR